MATNPILSELSGLSPGAKAALVQAHTAGQSAPPVNQGMAAPVAPTHIAAPADAPPPALPTGNPMSAPPSTLMGGSSPNSAPGASLGAGASADAGLPSLPAPPKAVAAPRGTLMGDQDERQRLISSGSGISQIENPWLKGLATAGNIIGGIAAPGLMRAIPGTEQHHNLLLNQANTQVGQDIGNAEKQAQTQELGAQTQQRQALAQQEQAKAQALLNPQQQKAEKPENLQQEYADAVADAVHRGVDPAQDPKVQQWGDAITSLQKQPAAPKEQNKDDKFIAIQSKMAAGQPLTPEETSFAKGYQKFVDVTKTAPGVARTSVLLQMPTAISDPNNPGNLIYSTKKGAIGQGAPGGAQTQVPLSVEKSATSGPIANTITSYNTAIGHLRQLGQAADALHNGDIQGINRVANEYGLQTGQAAPVEFQAVKAAVAGEVGKIFKGGAATDNEIKEFDHAISAANSPAQLHGVVNTYTHLMGSKKQALMQQVQQGVQGKTAFDVPQEGSHQVGDAVKIKGQSMKITAVHPDGSFDAK